MARQAGYNGAFKKDAFYKLKKHANLLTRRARLGKEIKKMHALHHKTLSQVLKAFLQVKGQTYDKKVEATFHRLESYRLALLKNKNLISYEVFGSDKQIAVQKICQRSASPKIWAQFLFFLTQNLSPNNFLEIGTNLGISGGYILEALKGNKNAYFVSMEGLPQLCDLARQHFQCISRDFELVEGLYEETFPQLMAMDMNYSVFFIDGNHQKDPTLSYYRLLKNKRISPAVFIFDDINHSQSMREAWETIKEDKLVSFSIDLFKLGIVIVEKNPVNNRQDFELFLAY